MKQDNKAFAKDIVITTLVLVLIAVISGALLMTVNHFASVSEAEILAGKLSKAYDAPGFSEDLLDKDFVEANKDNEIFKKGEIKGVYKPSAVPPASVSAEPSISGVNSNVVIIHALGKGAYKSTIEILVVIEDYKIINILKYKAEETPGLGANAFEKDHYEQYIKAGSFKDIDKFEITKTGEEGKIDAVTAATKTSTAMNNAVNAAITYYKINYDTLVGGAN